MEETSNVRIPLFETMQISPPKSENDDFSRYTPSNPIYFQKIDVQQLCDRRKEKLCRNKELKSLKSLPKKLKKKKPKNKKVDKILWDPSIQIPDLGNLSKYLKKKRKIAGITEAKERRNQCSKKSIAGKTSLMRKDRSVNTFDIIFTDESYLGKVPQSIREPSVVDDLAISTPQEFTPASHENNTFLVGDLIDLGTPETFRPKVIHNNDKQPPAMLKIDEIEEIFNFHPDSPSFKESSSVPLIDLPKPAASSSAETLINNDADSSDDPREQEGQETSLFVLEQELPPLNSSPEVEGISLSDQTNICKIRGGKPSNPIKRVGSPQLFDGSPGLTSPPEEEKQHIAFSGNPVKMLVDRLEKDPFPHRGRINAKTIVKRRAFSMDDTLMKCWLSKSFHDLDGVCYLLDSPNIIVSQASDTLEVECLTNNLVVQNETPCNSSVVVKNEVTGQITDADKKNFESNEIASNLDGILINSITGDIPTLPRLGLVDRTKEPLFKGSPRVENNCKILQPGASVLTDVSDINITNDDVPKNLSESSLQEESCTEASENIINEDQDLRQVSSVGQDGIAQIADVHSENSSTSNSLFMENQVSGVIEETQSLGIETANGELDHSGDSNLQPLESNPDVMAPNDTQRPNETTKKLHGSISGDESEVHSIDYPALLQTSFRNVQEEKVVSDCLDFGFPLTEGELPYRLDTVSAFGIVADNGVLKPDSTSQKTVMQAVVEKPSTHISVDLHLGNEPALDTTSILTHPGFDEIQEGLDDTSGELKECSSDETYISNCNSTFVVERPNSEELYKSGQSGLHRNEIQGRSSGPRQIDSPTESMHSSILGDGSDKSADTNGELEECSVDVTCYISDHNSTYVVDSGDSEKPYNSLHVDAVNREKILGNSSGLPQGDSSAGMTPATGDESNKFKMNTLALKDEITDTTLDDYGNDSDFNEESCVTPLQHWVLPAGKKFRRSLSIIRNLDEQHCTTTKRGRHYEKSVEEIIKLQGDNEVRTPVQSLRKRLSLRRSSWMRQMTPPPVRRSTFMWSPTIPERGTLYETPPHRRSVYLTPMQQHVVLRTSVRGSPYRAPRRSIRASSHQNCSPESPSQYTIRDLILTICKQIEPCGFCDILNENAFKGGCKLGEGVFGEVFSINRDCEYTVLKIIPIEGQDLINGEKQKTYSEVLSELIIAKVLHELRYEDSDESNLTAGYAELISTSLVQGCYPETLLEFWEEFDQSKGSDNDHPKVFREDQLFIVMEQGNGGKDLESYAFSSAKQSLSIFKQIAFSLAVAEISVEFEHRDLHWGNVLVSKTSEKQIYFTLNGARYSVASSGVKSTIIDYTLSRIKYVNQFPIYNDIGKDPEMFIATGDYQFDVYRLMKTDVDDDWSRFAPKTNARWLHYLLDKILTKVKYQRKTAKVHKDSLRVLEEIGSWMEQCGSALSIALRLAEMKN